MAMITCPKCGEKIPDTSRKCSKCGFDGIASYLLEEDRRRDIMQRDFELYQRDIREQERERRYYEKMTSNVPHCPTCGSTNVQKISGMKRWFSVGLFGLASSDVGKTMVCKKCGYKF